MTAFSGKKPRTAASDSMPSPSGRRVKPEISEDMKKKVDAAIRAKERKAEGAPPAARGRKVRNNTARILLTFISSYLAVLNRIGEECRCGQNLLYQSVRISLSQRSSCLRATEISVSLSR